MRHGIDDDHRHLLHLVYRRILCTCEPCWAMKAGDPDLRPTGTRLLLLDGFDLTDELWAKFQIPIGLTFFFRDGGKRRRSPLYPSPAGATEWELYLEAWNELVAANPVLAGLEHEVEALLVDRLSRAARVRDRSRSTAVTSWSVPSRQTGRASRAARRWKMQSGRSSPAFEATVRASA